MSYLTAQTSLILGEALIEFARVEKQIEVIRQILCEQHKFHPYLGFKMIDRINNNPKGYLLAGDIKTFLQSNGFVHDETRCKIFINNYDQDSDGTLQYSEFLRAILPLTNQALRQQVSLKQPQNLVVLDTQSQYTLARLIDKEIVLTLDLDHIKEQLNQCYDFAPSLCFQQIDRNCTGTIFVPDLERFFYENAIIVYDDELEAMFKRFDLLNDGMIDQDEFFRMLTAHQTASTNTPYYQSPTKSSQYLQRYLGTQKPLHGSNRKSVNLSITNTPPADVRQTYETPQKTMQRNQSTTSTSEKLRQSQTKVHEFDDTMSNVLTQSRTNTNTKILKQYDSPVKSNKRGTSQSQVKHLQKYIDQKTELRAQMQLSKLSANKSSQRKPSLRGGPNKSISRVLSSTPQSQVSTKMHTEQKKLNNTIKRDNHTSSTDQRSTKKAPVNNQMDPFQYYARVLDDVLAVEKTLEQMKQRLSKQQDFNLYDAFRAIDTSKFGYVTGEQLDQFVCLRPGTMNLLVLKYGQNNYLRFSDFIKLMIPKSRDFAEMVESRYPNKSQVSHQPHLKDKVFHSDTLKLFKETLLGCLEGEIRLDKVRDRVSRYELSDLKDAFELIDLKTHDGQLNLEDIDSFFLSQDMDYSIEDLQLLLRLLDHNGDGVVSLDDFVNKLSL